VGPGNNTGPAYALIAWDGIPFRVAGATGYAMGPAAAGDTGEAAGGATGGVAGGATAAAGGGTTGGITDGPPNGVAGAAKAVPDGTPSAQLGAYAGRAVVGAVGPLVVGGATGTCGIGGAGGAAGGANDGGSCRAVGTCEPLLPFAGHAGAPGAGAEG
jgi:hypothetical protein